MKLGNLYYPKLKLDNVKGSKSQKVFGSGHKSACEAQTAIFLAEYLAEPCPRRRLVSHGAHG